MARHLRQNRRPPSSRLPTRPPSKSDGRMSPASTMCTDRNFLWTGIRWRIWNSMRARPQESQSLPSSSRVSRDMTKIKAIDLEDLAREFRTQRIIFETARDVYDQMQENWRGGRVFLLAQLVRLVEQFIRSDRISITPALFLRDDLKRRLIITLNMNKVVQHIWEAIRFENTEGLEPVFDRDRSIRSTGDMGTWYTGRPCEYTARSHINFCVQDSTWEASEAFALDHAPEVAAWVKNDHLGFEVFYVYRGVVRKYRPDFLIRLRSGDMLVLETKGQDSEQNQTKRRFLDEWANAVNAHGGFGRWSWDVSLAPGDIQDILSRHAGTGGA